MFSKLSSNVIAAKARAMYGRLLNKENYAALLRCTTVSEVAAYLKNHTDYQPVLADINEAGIHRDHLEALLQRSLLNHYASLCRYELSVDKQFADYLIMNNEIQQILHALILQSAGRADELLFSVPAFFLRHTRLDLFALSKATDYDSFLAALHNTDYVNLLAPFRPDSTGVIDFTSLENRLYSYMYKKIFAIIDKHYTGEAKHQLYDLFGSYIDIQNFSRIIRLKKYYRASEDYIRSILLPFNLNIPPKLLDEIITSQSADDCLTLFEKTIYGKDLRQFNYLNLEDFELKNRYKKSRRYLHFSIHPTVIMLSYIFISEIEISDLTNLIEGIRYQLPAEEIAKFLVIYHF